jgi:hypothetical protein
LQGNMGLGFWEVLHSVWRSSLSLKLKKQVKRIQQTIPKTGVSVLPRCVCIDTYRILQLFYTCLRPSFFRNRSNLQPPFSVSNWRPKAAIPSKKVSAWQERDSISPERKYESVSDITSKGLRRKEEVGIELLIKH